MVRIICVVDNAVQSRSSMWGEHGLAFWIETDQGSALFDTGRSGTVLLHNLETLGLSLQDLNALMFSHAHYDHTGGLSAVLSQNPGLPIYANADFPRSRFSLSEGEYKSIGLPTPSEELVQQADLRLSSVPVEVLPGLWTTGEISERPELEGCSDAHFIQDNGEWQPDPYRDDMSLVMETSQGLVVIFGCCHAGMLNTLAHVQRTFDRPVIAVVGGTHLISASETDLDHIIDVLRELSLPRFYLNHCTGELAYIMMVNAFGAQVKTCPAGTVLAF